MSDCDTTTNPPLKRCSKCGQEKPWTAEYYPKDKRSLSGIQQPCRECKRAWNTSPEGRAYYKAWETAPEIRERRKAARNTPQAKARKKAYEATSEYKSLQRAYNASPKNKAYLKNWYASPEGKAYKKAYKSTPEYKAHEKAYRASPQGKKTQKTGTQRHIARKRSLPATFTTTDWNYALAFFHGACAYCCNPPSLFDHHQTLHADHYIPISDPSCPGTVSTNMLPACQSCNLSKSDTAPHVWLVSRFGKRRAAKIEARIQAYFDEVRH